jgi:hypothetical protein
LSANYKCYENIKKEQGAIKPMSMHSSNSKNVSNIQQRPLPATPKSVPNARKTLEIPKSYDDEQNSFVNDIYESIDSPEISANPPNVPEVPKRSYKSKPQQIDQDCEYLDMHAQTKSRRLNRLSDTRVKEKLETKPKVNKPVPQIPQTTSSKKLPPRAPPESNDLPLSSNGMNSRGTSQSQVFDICAQLSQVKLKKVDQSTNINTPVPRSSSTFQPTSEVKIQTMNKGLKKLPPKAPPSIPETNNVIIQKNENNRSFLAPSAPIAPPLVPLVSNSRKIPEAPIFQNSQSKFKCIENATLKDTRANNALPSGDVDIISQIKQGVKLKKVDRSADKNSAPSNNGDLCAQILQGVTLRKVGSDDTKKLNTSSCDIESSLRKVLATRSLVIRNPTLDESDSDSSEQEWDD